MPANRNTKTLTSCPPPEAQYRRDGYYVNSKGDYVWYSLAHGAHRCDVCEFPFSNLKQHPSDPEAPELQITCDMRRVKIVSRFES